MSLTGIERIGAYYSGYTVSMTAAQLTGFSAIGTSVRLTDTGTVSLAGLTFTGGSIYLAAGGNTLNLSGLLNGGGYYGPIVNGDAGNDIVIGSSSGDTLNGGGGNDTLSGGDGGDTLNGGVGIDLLKGEGGDDILSIEVAGEVQAGDVFNGGVGTDTLRFLGYGTLDLTAASLIGIENLASYAEILLTKAQLNGLTTIATTIRIADGGDVSLAGVNFTGLAINLSDADTRLDLSSALGGGYYVNYFTVNGAAGNDIITGGDAGGDQLKGGGGNDELRGGGGDDTLWGENGNDAFFGGAGNDTYYGGIGDDIYYVEAGDSVGEYFNEGIDTIRTGLTSYTLGANLEKLTYTGTAAFTGTGNTLANTITGGAARDTLSGLAGDDMLDGGANADTMIGGIGNDYYHVDNAGDVATELAGEGNDTVILRSFAAYTLGANLEGLLFQGSGAFAGTGNGEGNFISTLLATSPGDDTLKGMAGDDMLFSGAGNDTLDGGTGADSMGGGAGDDIYIVDNAMDLVIEDPGEGVDTVRSSVTFSLYPDIENLTLTGAGAINATGNDLANILIGNAAANVLDGGLGADRMEGANGSDTYIVDNAGDVIVEVNGTSGGTDIAKASISYTLGAGVAVETLTTTNDAGIDAIDLTGNELVNRIIGNAGANLLKGGAGNDRLEGGAGDDTLDGGTGADLLMGGAGDDLYLVDDAADAITEANAAGVDTVKTAIAAYTLTNYVEKLVYTGAAAFAGTGSDTDNEITGGNGADTLKGMAGNDTLLGGNGVDRLEGGLGHDVLDGGAGLDVLIGGAGNDTYFINNPTETITELANEGIDTVSVQFAAYTLGANLEKLTYTGAGAFTGTGNELDNTLNSAASNANAVLRGMAGNDALTTGGGNDQLDGGVGADVMTGGAGDDIYVVDSGGDKTIELAGEGVDTVRSSMSHVLQANVENLTLTGGATSSATGNALANVLIGNGSANLLDGGAGADRMEGGGGGDTYKVDDAGDVIVEANTPAGGSDIVMASLSYTLTAGAAVELLTTSSNSATTAIDLTGNELANRIAGNAGANRLSGVEGNDRLEGNAGDDWLDGGVGNDLLIGGTGADHFVFGDALGVGNVDTVSDFVHASDVIELDGSIFAAIGAGTLSASAFGTGTAATTADQRIVYDKATGNLFYDADGSGAGAAVLFANLQNKTGTLSASDFHVTDAAAPLAFAATTGWLPQLDAPQTDWALGSDTGLF